MNTSADTLKVLVCDPDPLVRAGIRGVIESVEHATVVGEQGKLDNEYAVAATEYDVAVVSAKGASSGELDMILFVDPDDRRGILDAIVGGATRLVSRVTAIEDIESALFAVLSGLPYLSPSLIEHLLALLVIAVPPNQMATKTVEQLSSREVDVLLLIGGGMTNTEISKKLSIRETTVRSHVARILSKLNISTRAEAVLVGHGLIVESRYA